MKTVFTIPPDVPFAKALAEGFLNESGGDPLALADYLILLPTRRACLHLREAFRQAMNGRAALLPRMQPLGELDEDEFYFSANATPDIPPAITPLRRQLLLAQLIRRKEPDMPLDQAALLAEALARLLDEVQTVGLDFSGLEKLVTEKELAGHWQQTVAFLEILTKVWPAILAEEGCIDPADRRNRVLAAQAAAWRAQPPKARVIAAGSTGSIPATAELLKVIASLPGGAVILPGLDCDLQEDAWQEVNESHPQFGMKELLEQLSLDREDVKIWNADAPRPARVRLLQESMRPAEVSEEWRYLKPEAIPVEALKGLTRLTLDHPQEEARAIALIMRHTLEVPGKTASLVTSDRGLAERVTALLDRWNIRINDTAGIPLSARPTGGFLTGLLAAGKPDTSRVALLSLLKHPLAACGMSMAECRSRARQIEIDLWRRAERTDDDRHTESEVLLQQFQRFLLTLTENWNTLLPLTNRIAMHRHIAEAVAASDVETGATRLWHGEEGEAAATWLDDWNTAAHGFPALNGSDYMDLFTGLLRMVIIRSSWGLHPRLSILGPLEARLIHADLMILGGLNERSWPPEAPADPWMSRPMKTAFGLPLPERRIGLSAHDFVQLASAHEVVLTRSTRMEGAPSVPSRFLLQLETVLRALGYSTDDKDALAAQLPWRDWAKALDEPLASEIKPCAPPQPRPTAEHRPKGLSVTEIGTWRRNPYAIYARHILGLYKLDALEVEPDAAERGTVIHDALEAFILKYPHDLPADALEQLLSLGREGFAAYAVHPEVRAFWWPRFERIAAWFVAEEHERRNQGIKVLKGEARGHVTLGDFTLKGRADRIEKHADGGLGVADYKTGSVPGGKEISGGYEPQLPLLALIAQEGGFESIAASPVSEMAYWKLNGGRDGSEIRPVKDVAATLIANARAGLEELIAKFSDPATPYQAVPKPGFMPRFDDYAHLARLREWGRTEEDQ